jgi:hypothetical protein
MVAEAPMMVASREPVMKSVEPLLPATKKLPALRACLREVSPSAIMAIK